MNASLPLMILLLRTAEEWINLKFHLACIYYTIGLWFQKLMYVGASRIDMSLLKVFFLFVGDANEYLFKRSNRL